MVHAFTCKVYEKLQFCFLESLVFIHQMEKSQEE